MTTEIKISTEHYHNACKLRCVCMENRIVHQSTMNVNVDMHTGMNMVMVRKFVEFVTTFTKNN